MGEYECINCNEMFWADEPSEDMDLCDECRKEIKEKPCTPPNVVLETIIEQNLLEVLEVITEQPMKS
jgi:hypothetical protein